MSLHQDVVAAYFEAFGRTDHEGILATLTDDVVWNLVGHTVLRGKEEFDGEIENDAIEGDPEISLDRMFEDGDTVVVLGRGSSRFKNGSVIEYAFSDAFTFRGDLICQIESYIVSLTPLPEGMSFGQ
jgi:ketosteroid isomerase-like protein